MRVIGGKYRGRKLLAPQGEDVRPTLDRVKENLFNILQNEIRGAFFLDLFGGTGAIGLEAVSRGARAATVVEKDFKNVKIIKENFRNVLEEFEIVNADSLLFLEKTDKKYDIIYADPPYLDGLYDKVVNLIYKRELLKPNGLLVLESEAPFDNEFLGFKVKSVRKYGRVFLTFLYKGE